MYHIQRCSYQHPLLVEICLHQKRQFRPVTTFAERSVILILGGKTMFKILVSTVNIASMSAEYMPSWARWWLAPTALEETARAGQQAGRAEGASSSSRDTGTCMVTTA